MRGRGQGPHALGAPAPEAREAGGGAHRGRGQHTVAPRIGHVGAGEVVPEHAAHPVVVALLGLQDQLPRKPLLGAAAPEATPAALQDGAHLPAGVCLLVPGDAGRFAVSESRGHRPPEAPPRALPAHSASWFPNPLTASSAPSRALGTARPAVVTKHMLPAGEEAQRLARTGRAAGDPCALNCSSPP